MNEQVNNEVAVNFYKKHLVRMREYNKRNPEIINKRSREFFQKIKAEPEKYKHKLDKKKQYYKLKKMKSNETETDNEVIVDQEMIY
jgi:hypothetical protein